jgi:hypothetical protein
MDSNYNLGGLIARIKDKLDDQEFPAETITQFINDAYFDIMGEEHYQFLERKYKAAAQKSGVLVLPRDFQSVVAFTAKDGKNLWPFRYMPYNDYLSIEKDSGIKNYRYTLFGNELFYTVPNIEDDDYEDGEERFYDLNMYYLARPLPLARETDVPLIPYEFGEILVLGALARCERRRDNFDYAAIYENKLDELVTNMKLRYCPRQQSGSNRARLPFMFRGDTF